MFIFLILHIKTINTVIIKKKHTLCKSQRVSKHPAVIESSKFYMTNRYKTLPAHTFIRIQKIPVMHLNFCLILLISICGNNHYIKQLLLQWLHRTYRLHGSVLHFFTIFPKILFWIFFLDGFLVAISNLSFFFDYDVIFTRH